MATLGAACQILALATAVYGALASLLGARLHRPAWVASGRRAVFAVTGLAAVSFAILEAAYLRSDFSYVSVYGHSSTTTPVFFKATAAWSSQEGSLLLWLFLLGVWSSVALLVTRRRLRDVQPYAVAVLMTMAAFFAALLVFAASPFETFANVPVEGRGLQPLLRNPGMVVHPPMLYSGYTLFTIPFAFAVGALVVRRVDAEWIQATRRFTLAAWFCLGVGIVLGARWSYSELGWGGYWAWDPVENASLLPWLTGTAFLHSVMVQERRGMLKVWNASLILATGTLAILGTFLVRSGILSSIHAFGSSTVGGPFLVLIATMLIGSVVLVTTRRDVLRTEHRLDSLLSREAVFLANNLVLVALAFVVFWGTFFPLISEAVTGTKAAVGPPWFDRYAVPLTLLLVLLSGIGPTIAWRRATAANARRGFVWPLGVAAAVLVAGLALGTASRPYALAMFVGAGFVLGCVGQELVRGVRARRAMEGGGVLPALGTLVARNRRRYGGYVVHVGMAVLFVGVAASSAFQKSADVRLQPGQSATVDGYRFDYEKATGRVVTRDGRLERLEFGSVVKVTKAGRLVGVLRPNRGYYPADAPFAPISAAFQGESTSEVGLKAGLTRDVWMAMAPDLSKVRPVADRGDRVLVGALQKVGSANVDAARYGAVRRAFFDETIAAYTKAPPPATFRLLVSPLVAWVWLGAILTFTGGLICLWPSPDALRRRADARYKARIAREVAAVG